MELVYLWVEKYKNIEKQGFNFSSKYKCKFEPIKYNEEKIITNGNLKIHQNDGYFKNFFDNDETEIIAVVGENGSGKSTLFEILSLSIFEQNIDKLKNILLFFIDEETLSLYCFNAFLTVKHEHIKIGPNDLNIDSNTKYKFNYINNFRTDDIVCHFFSNWFTPDFTTKFRRFQEIYEFHQGVLPEKHRYKAPLSEEESDSFFEEKTNLKLMELLRKDNNYFHFVNQSDIFLFDTVDIVLFSHDEFMHQINYEKRLDFREYWYLIHKVFYDPYLSVFIIELLEYTLSSLYDDEEEKFNELLHTYSHLELTLDFEDDPTKDISPLIQKNIELFIDFLKDILFSFKIEKFQFIAENFDDILYYGQKILLDNILSFNINSLNEIDMIVLNILHQHHIKKIEFKNSLTLATLKDFSSGEQSVIQFLSNMFHALENDANFRNKIYFCDEIEVRLHPNWQKQLISLIVKGIKYHEKKKLKCIFATHSPFILSDLPKENVIFLDKVDEKTKEKYPKLNIDGLKNSNCINVSNHINIKPFGANIHTLLSHGFFMEDGLMGEFAKEKINDVYDFFIRENYIGRMNQGTAQKLINFIGEPILRKELQTIYNDKFIGNDIDKLIKAHEDEIARLKMEKEKR